VHAPRSRRRSGALDRPSSACPIYWWAGRHNLDLTIGMLPVLHSTARRPDRPAPTVIDHSRRGSNICGHALGEPLTDQHRVPEVLVGELLLPGPGQPPHPRRRLQILTLADRTLDARARRPQGPAGRRRHKPAHPPVGAPEHPGLPLCEICTGLRARNCVVLRTGEDG
jgi:hypothetical protein